MADEAKNNTKKIEKDKQDKNKKDQENEKIKSDKKEKTETDPKDPNVQLTNTNNKSNEPEVADANTKTDSENQNSTLKNDSKVSENKTGDKSNVKAPESKTEGKSDVKTNKTKTKTDGRGDTKADGTKGEKPVEPVEVQIVQNHYKSHAKSTLPHILTEYGLEDKDHPVVKKQPKKKKKKRSEHVSDTEDEDRARRKAREEQMRRNFGDRQTDTYYMEYLDFLEQKVIQQRQKAQREKEEAEKLRILRIEEESDTEAIKKAPEVPPPSPPEKQRRHFVRRLERIELKHDDSFMRNLPKTDTARIIELQDKLRREGKLKTQYDVDQFWKDIRKPDVFYEHFKVKKKDAGPDEHRPPGDYNASSKDDVDDDDDEPKMAPRSLSHISEASKDRESWAITQKYQSSHGPKTPTEKKRKDDVEMAKDAALDLEIRCPKLEMPPLACFSLRLGEKPPDPEDITKKLALKSREKERKKLQRKINKMYQMAMTNTAAANRILDNHKDLTDMLEGAALRDVRNFCCEPRVPSYLTELAVFDEPYPTLEDYYRDLTDPTRALEAPAEPERLSQASRSQATTRQSSAASRKLTPISDKSSRPGSKSSKKKKSPEMIEYPAPMPLTLAEVTHREKTMEAKCMSTYWTNYMHAGKSVFAHT